MVCTCLAFIDECHVIKPSMFGNHRRILCKSLGFDEATCVDIKYWHGDISMCIIRVLLLCCATTGHAAGL